MLAILFCTSALAVGPLSVGESGDWALTFEDGSTLLASSCSVERQADGETSKAVYRAPQAEVTIVSRKTGNAVDFAGRIASKSKTVTDFAFPARLRFDPAKCRRLVFPADKSAGNGFSFNGAFFRKEIDPARAMWAGAPRPKNLRGGIVFGKPMRMGALDESPVPVRVTDEGRRLLPVETVAAVERRGRFRVNRANAPEDSDVVLVDSEHGGLVTATRCGGTGALWRVGQADPKADGKVHRELVRGLLVAAVKGKARPRIAVIALARGPERGSFVCGMSVREAVELAQKAGDVVELKGFDDLEDAWKSRRYDCLVNPYGEYVPCRSPEGLPETEAAVADYVKRGGVWVELGGATFHSPLCPRLYQEYRGTYPSLFCDFVQHEGTDGSTTAIYAVRNKRPFVPGKLACGGDEQGGWIDHGFVTWIRPGETWTSPTVRIRRGGDLQANVDAYVRDNGLVRTLSDKAGDRLDDFKKALFFKLDGSANELRQAIPRLERPTMVHVSRYLHGGFDRQYPDHLPPAASFGTGGEFRSLLDELHAAGHYFCPYTNPTWWCDDPKGPTFLAEGEDAIAIGRDGRRCRCSYGPGATGYAISFFHPAVIRANLRTRQQFQDNYPCDWLFQDECGARHMAYDFNPAAPSPVAYLDGLIGMLDGDSAKLPLVTEEGWDQVANRETALCGLHWRTIPLSEKSRPMQELVKASLPPHLWTYENLAQRMMHDKCLFLLHDLGAFVHEPRSLAWTLALGYHLSVRMGAAELGKDSARTRWYRWLAELQRRVVSRMDGGRVVSFSHDRGPLLARGGDPRDRLDDGIVRAQYGDVRLLVNLGNVPRTVDGRQLAPYGWFIEAPGLEAAALEGANPRISECGKVVAEYVK